VSACYVYGLTRSDARLPDELAGVDGAPVELVAHGEVAALVSPVPTDRPLGNRDDLFAHERVVDAVARDNTVLPVRFGSVVRPEGVVDELLAPHTDELTAALAELDGQVQYTVKGRFVRETVLREVIESDPEIAELNARVRDQPEDELHQDRVRLGELVVGELEARRQAEGPPLHERLAGLATAASTRQSSDPEQVLDSAFLVPRQRSAEFEDAVERIAAEVSGRVAFSLGGPLAPYDFAGVRE
jgi:hypothetical protein